MMSLRDCDKWDFLRPTMHERSESGQVIREKIDLGLPHEFGMRTSEQMTALIYGTWPDDPTSLAWVGVWRTRWKWHGFCGWRARICSWIYAMVPPNLARERPHAFGIGSAARMLNAWDI
jgi:hypothetical protein